MKEWTILDPGEVPSGARKVLFTCTECGADATLPVVGVPIAQAGAGLVFDRGPRSLPSVIECPVCKVAIALETAINKSA